jgi:preprotein translocase subunit SecE
VTNIIRFFNEVAYELGKVKWPTRKDLVVYGITVFFVVLVSAAMLGFMDIIFRYLVTGFLGW